MKNRNMILSVLAAILLLTLAGCGASSSSGGSSTVSYAAGGGYDSVPMEAPMPMEMQSTAMSGSYAKNTGADYGWVDAEFLDAAEESSIAQDSGAGNVLPANVKMIYTADISLESTEFDTAAAGLETLVSKCGGWFESSETDNSRSYRTAYFTVRVPARNFFSFCDQVGSLCQVNSIRRSAQDVSESYYDTESRLETQKTKLKRLQELLAQAEDMADIITLESAISDTEYTIEQLTGTLRKYDSLVGYSTVEISLREVYKLTEMEEPAIGFGAKLSSAFRTGSRSFVDGMEDFLLGFAEAWAGWLLFIAIVVCAIIFIPRFFRNRKERRERRRERKAAEKAEKERSKQLKNTDDSDAPAEKDQ